MPALGWLKTIPLPALAAFALLASAYGLGRALLRPLKLHATCAGAGALASLALGLGVLATAAYALGVIGFFGRGTLGSLAFGAAAVALGTAWTYRKTRAREPAPTREPAEAAVAVGAGSRIPWNLDFIGGGVLFLLGFAYAALPPYFYDALVYHLALPARYLASGSIAPPPDLALAAYPQNAEMLSAVAMSLGGESAAQIFNYLVAWAGIAGLWWFLRARTSRVAASVGALIVLAPWPFWFISTCSKNDLLGAVFLLGSFAILAGGGGGVLRRALVAGCLAGFGVGTKYTNVLAALALFIAVPFVVERGFRAKAAAGFAVALVLAAAPWPARNAVAFDNPVYPILGHKLGSPQLTLRGAQTMSEETGQVMDRTPLGIVRRLAALGMDEAAFGWASRISPILLPAMILGLFVTRRRDLRLGLALGCAVLIFGLSLLTAYVRTFAFAWLLGALAPAALLDRTQTRVAQAFTLSMFGMGIVAAIVPVPIHFEQYSAHGSRVFLGRETPQAFAERHANYLPLALGPMRELPENARVMVVGGTRAAYFPRAAEWSYVWDEPPIKTLFATGATPEDVVDRLRARGITHLLVNGPEMARNERRYNWLGLGDPEMREWFTGVVRELSLVANANDCYLYALPPGLPRTGRVARSQMRSSRER